MVRAAAAALRRQLPSFTAAASPEYRRPPERRQLAKRREDWSSAYTAAGMTPSYVANALAQANLGNMVAMAQLIEQIEESDPSYRAVLMSRILSVVGQEWSIVPGRGRSANRIAAACDDMLRSLPRMQPLPGEEVLSFEDAATKLMSGISRHLAAAEIEWSFSSGQAMPLALWWAPPARFRYNTQWPEKGPLGQLRIITDNDRTFGEPLMQNGWIVHRPEARCSAPNRAGLGRVVLKWEMYKWAASVDWVTFAEKFGQPMRMATYDAQGTGPEEREALYDALATLGTDAYALFPNSVQLTFPDPGSKRDSSAVYEGLLAYCDAQISKAVLGHSAAADSTAGNLGNEDMAREVRQDFREADEAALSSTIRRDLLTPFVRFNFGTDAPVPYIEWDVKQTEDLDSLGKRIGEAVGYGLHVPSAWAHEVMRIPAPQPGDAILVKPDPMWNPTPTNEPRTGEPPAPPPAAPPDAAATEPAQARALAYAVEAALPRSSCCEHHLRAADDDKDRQDAARLMREHTQQADSLHAAAMDEGLSSYPRYSAPVRRAVGLATSHADLLSRLEALRLDSAEIQQVLEQTQYAAHALGRGQGAQLSDALTGSIGRSWAPLPAVDAEAWLRKRVVLNYDAWKASSAAIKARSFSLARHEGDDLIAAIKGKIQQSLDNGEAYRTFASNYAEMMGEIGRTASNPYHVETVFRNATQNALSVGRYRQMTDPDALAERPYWQYLTVGDSEVRDEHAAIDGEVYPADHEFWAVFYPPNGHSCRCAVTSLSEDDVKGRGIDVKRSIPESTPRPAEGWDVAPWVDESAAKF